MDSNDGVNLKGYRKKGPSDRENLIEETDEESSPEHKFLKQPLRPVNKSRTPLSKDTNKGINGATPKRTEKVAEANGEVMSGPKKISQLAEQVFGVPTVQAIAEAEAKVCSGCSKKYIERCQV